MPLRQSILSWLFGSLATLCGRSMTSACSFWLLAFMLTSASSTVALAQDTPPPLPSPPADSSAAVILPDSLIQSDSTLLPLPSANSSGTLSRSSTGLDKPIQFSAKDSLVIVFDDTEGDEGNLVGNANVQFGEIKLDAYSIDILFEKSELLARGLPVDTGMVGMPTFAQGTETFSGSSFAYNLETERGRVVGARTNYDEGFIEAGIAKVKEDSTLYILDGLYTTCNCAPGETPSYSLRSHKMKIVDQKWIYTGPIQLYIYNVPMPIWLPFGMLPNLEGRRSGPLPPEVGEDQRGFFVKNWGWYWAINDFMDLQVRAGVWTKGSWQINPSYRYNRRNRYSGGVSIDFLHERNGEKEDPDFQTINRGSLRWTHNQTLNPTAKFTANVNLATADYNQRVSDRYDDNVRQTISSAIQFNKRWSSGGRSFSINLRQNQVLATGVADLTLPEVRFSQSTRTPFKRSQRLPGQDEQWFEKITVSYDGRLSNLFNFTPLPDDSLIVSDPEALDFTWWDALFDQGKYERATGKSSTRFNIRATHSVPIAAPFIINRIPIINRSLVLNVSPNFRYSEDWYSETERRSVDSTNTLQIEKVADFFALRQFQLGVSANTTIYGIFPVKAGSFEGLRHTVRPRLSFNYRPDYSNDFWGYTKSYIDTSGAVIKYGLVPQVPFGKQQALSYGFDNVFETKRVRTDSTGERRINTLKLFNVNLSSSYNFAADSLRMAPISVSARTRILNRVNVNFSSRFSPYKLNEQGQTINDYVFSLRHFAFARMTSLRLSADFSLRSSQSARTPSSGVDRSPFPNQGGLPSFDYGNSSGLGTADPFSYGFQDDARFADFSIPWSLDFRLSYSLNRSSVTTRTFTINSNFDFNVTPNWRIRGQTGYDLERRELVTTSLNIFRNFECWEMSLRWVPFGQFQSYGFDLHVKSGKLRDLLRIRQPRNERDRGFL